MKQNEKNPILIVDDEQSVATIIQLHLERAGFSVTWAEHGDRALELLAGNGYCLVLLDYRMPGASGVEVLQRIRQSGSDAAVIMMTGHGSEQLAVECMKTGAVDYLVKPFSMEDLVQRVERAIENRAIRIQNRRLEQEKEDFLSMMSHDMKNPIAAVIGSIDIVREERLGPLNEEQKEYLQSAVESCNDVVSMIDNLLDIRRYEAGRLHMNIRRQNLTEVVRQAVNRFGRAAERDGIRIEVSLADKVPDVLVDSTVFNRVMGNLMGNAIKYTPEGGEIHIICDVVGKDQLALLVGSSRCKISEHIQKADSAVRIRVRDTGEGISPEDQERIFERYVQVNRGDGWVRSGVGLGLAFCRMAIEGFHGSIWAGNAPEQGSEFVILLPGCV